MKVLKYFFALVLGGCATLIALYMSYSVRDIGINEKDNILVMYSAFSSEFLSSEAKRWSECEKFKVESESKSKSSTEIYDVPDCNFEKPIYIKGAYDSLDEALAKLLSKNSHYKFIPLSLCKDESQCSYINYETNFITANIVQVKIWAFGAFSYEYLVLKIGDSAIPICVKGYII